MKIRKPIRLLVAAAFVTSAGAIAAGPKHAHEAPLASATLKAADGSTKGQASIAGHAGHWELKIDVDGLPAGVHGAHLHTVGKCEGPDFTTAGPHLNPHGKMHGSENPKGKHLGDLPNLTVGENGKGSFKTALSDAALATTLFDADGTALVIHAAADDYRSDPSGNSGGRIACGVLTRTR